MRNSAFFGIPKRTLGAYWLCGVITVCVWWLRTGHMEKPNPLLPHMLLNSSSDQSAKQTSADPVRAYQSAVTSVTVSFGFVYGADRGISSLPLPQLSGPLGSNAGGRWPMHYQHLIPSTLEGLNLL